VTLHVGGGLAALLLLLSTLTAVSAGELVATRDDGTEIARLPVPEGAGWCVLWNHSVQGFPVADCYENRDGHMVLVRSRQPDFAAGLGHIPGRGRQVADGAGGYWILDIDEPVPGDAYVLRPGAGPVDPNLQVGDTVVSLSQVAARQRVRIALTGE
jgi:hypothetical protein